MPNELSSASLRPAERRLLERFVSLLQCRLGDALVAAWLFGSRARGEQPHADSDVDLMVVTRPGGWPALDLVYDLLDEAAADAHASPSFFRVHVRDPDWVTQRRQIGSFFMREIDRDKVVLAGEP